MRRLNVLAIYVFLTLLACQASIDLTTWLERPSGSVLFQDEFTDPSSGWERVPRLPQGGMDYVEGVYRIQVNGPGQLLWSGPRIKLRDVRIEVDLILLSDEADDDFGVVCRAVDNDNFYFLAISSDGYYGIGKVKEGIQELLGSSKMPPSEVIVKGQSRNHLRADCIADQLTLYANGHLLASAQDAEFTRGRVGLMAGTLGAGVVDVLYDNFSVLAP